VTVGAVKKSETTENLVTLLALTKKLKTNYTNFNYEKEAKNLKYLSTLRKKKQILIIYI